jgi:hypothetical protein
MSKKQQYTTKFYEDNGGGIQAVTRDESGKVVNVLGGFEDGSITGLEVLAAARENWPDADPFESYQWGGKTMEEVAEELEEMEYHPGKWRFNRRDEGNTRPLHRRPVYRAC